MGGKQSGHNNNLPPKFNSIHYKRVINTGKVEGMNSASYNTSCNGEMRWDGDGDDAGGEDDVDDDLDDVCDDGDDDLPSGICPPKMAFLLCGFPPQSGGGTPENSSRVFG